MSNKFYSVDAFMGQVAHRLCDHLGSPVDLLCALVFHDTDRQHFLDRAWASADATLFLAELLVLCIPLRRISSRFELLDSLAISRRLLTAQRAAARQTRCQCPPSRREYSRTTASVP